jgi:hypothetical protein
VNVERTDRFHAFDRLVLTLVERSMVGVRTELEFELRATRTGAEVWRSSVLHAEGGSCASGERFVGLLTTRQVIELLEDIERSGVYEALPRHGLVDGAARTDDDRAIPMVSMQLFGRERAHQVFTDQPADDDVVHYCSEAVRKRVELAMERALTRAG